MKHTRYFLIALTWLASSVALAQWQWVDKDGRKVFSDRPPSADVPEKSIIKRPGGGGPITLGAATPASAPVSAASTTAPQLTGVDKDLLMKKKMAEEAQASKRKAEKERMEAAKAENCIRAKQTKTNLSSNLRLFQMNEKGERVQIDEAARAAELQRAQSFIDADC